MSGSIKYDLSKLDNFIKLVDDKHQVRVGIFGNKNARGTSAQKKSGQSGGQTNADIGFKHEYGVVSEHIPARSFLRMPLALKGAQIVKEASPDAAKLMAEGKIPLLLKRLGWACENAIQRAFATRGYGNWKENAPSTIRRKKSDSPLIDTSQLRRSISSKVVSL